MGENSQIAFSFACRVAPAMQRGSQSTLKAGDDAFNLPALPVFAAVKALGHLPAIAPLGHAGSPTPAAAVFPLKGRATSAAVEVNYRGTDPQALPGHPVIGLGIVAAVGQQSVNFQIPGGLEHRRPEETQVVAGPDTGDCRGNQMALGVTDNRQLGILAFAVAAVAVSPAPGIVGRTDRRLQSCRVDGRFRLLVDQPNALSIREDRTEQIFKAPFFPRRFRAWNRVVWCGSFFSAKVLRRSARSARRATMPRSSVQKNCSKTRIASNWCWVKSFLENLDEYAGMASEATCRAFLANATGERVETRRLVVSMSNIMQ
jgi:hypothetical protein